MAVQTFITLAFMYTFIALGIMACEIVRYPLKFVLRYEWLLTTISFIGIAGSGKIQLQITKLILLTNMHHSLILALFIFFGVLIFGVNAYRRDWLMYPKFNVISWSFAFAVVAMFIFAFASFLLYKDAKKAYELRREAKNLVQQMQMQETASIPSTHSRNIHGYI